MSHHLPERGPKIVRTTVRSIMSPRNVGDFAPTDERTSTRRDMSDAKRKTAYHADSIVSCRCRMHQLLLASMNETQIVRLKVKTS